MGRSVLNEAPPAGDKLKKIHYHRFANTNSPQIAGTAEAVYWRTDTFTTTTTNATLIVFGQLWGVQGTSDQCGVYAQLVNSDNSNYGSEDTNNDSQRHRGVWYAGINHSADWSTFLMAWHKTYNGVPPGTYRYQVGHKCRNNQGGNHFAGYIDPQGGMSSTDNRSQQKERVCMIYECEASDSITHVAISDGGF